MRAGVSGGPHGVALQLVPELLAKGRKVIDLGADFRFRDFKTYESWYKHQHSQPELTKNAVYGLPELYRNQIREARVVGNPGCYPTSAILGIYPALKNGLIDPASIIIDSKSGSRARAGKRKSATCSPSYSAIARPMACPATGIHRRLSKS